MTNNEIISALFGARNLRRWVLDAETGTIRSVRLDAAREPVVEERCCPLVTLAHLLGHHAVCYACETVHLLPISVEQMRMWMAAADNCEDGKILRGILMDWLRPEVVPFRRR